MDVQDLKERIILDDKIETILSELGMHHIKIHNGNEYYSCGMPDGDNQKSTIIYIDSLYVDAYTRNIKDQYGNSDIISLVSYIRKTYFSESIKWICEICGYDYYSDSLNESRLAKWVRQVYKNSIEKDDEIDVPLKPINENILKYFKKCGNSLFFEDGIDYHTQEDFEYGYDLMTHSITIPIRDELGTLVGVKGRLFKNEIKEWENKYFYIMPCSKTRLLYGLYKTMPYIKSNNEVIVVESEKSVAKLWSYGYKNAVAIGGHVLSKRQIELLTRLNVDVVIAYDRDVEIDKNGIVNKDFYNSEFEKFLPQQRLFCVYDKGNKLLKPKESPCDRRKIWEELYANRIKIR